MPLAPSIETGSLGVCHLKRIWSAAIAARSGTRIDRGDEGELDRFVIHAMGLGLHQAMRYLHGEAPTFAQFEEWIATTAGRPDAIKVERLNAAIAGEPPPDSALQWIDEIEKAEPVLIHEDLECWEQNGYVVLKNAVPEEMRAAAEDMIWKHMGADPDSPDSWYPRGRDIHGIMIEVIQHPALEANRRSTRIHKAFSQLRGTANLWVSADRCGFHPPQREGHPFPGPDLHWDIDFTKPNELSTGGILYLTDTPPEQGALTVVPGFHRRLEGWLKTLAPGADPQREELHALGSRAIGANAGDLVIWHESLPHGSRPNLGTRPRMVQYINMFPGVALPGASLRP